jgi:hypothetical protein
MADAQFGEDLQRVIVSQLFFLNAMTAAREMYGKSYFSLGIGEKAAVDQAVFANVQSNFQSVTPQLIQNLTPAQPPTSPQAQAQAKQVDCSFIVENVAVTRAPRHRQPYFSILCKINRTYRAAFCA